ncbi:MAG: T9SS type A sorting domain-containing protein, partial [Saprospiraceae bacterium]
YDATSQPPCTAPQSGELVSPVINLSNVDVPGVSLQFFQVVRNLNSRFFVGYSTDGGDTWVETPINTDLEINGPPLNNILKIPLPGLAGSPQARFKFRMEGDYYYWMIDDVRIVEQEHHNLSLNKNFYAIPPNYATPYNLVEPIHFLTDVSNIGSVAQTNTNLKMTVLNAQNQQVFQTTQTFGQLPPNTSLENVLLNESFEPGSAGTYRGSYRVSADAADADKSNNQASFEFKVTYATWAKEAGATRSVCPDATAWEPGESHSWTFGNHFVTPELQNFQVSVSSVSFSIDNSQNSGAAAGEVALIAVYEWVDANNDGNVQDVERFGITFGSYVVTGTETADDIITVPLNDITPLESNTHYLVMLEYTAPDALTDLWLAASDAFDYNAMIYLHSQEVLAMPRYASFMAIGELATATYVPNGFGTDIVPVIRLHSGEKVEINRRTSSNTLTAYPNPAKDVLNVTCKFEQPAQDVVIRVVDATGKTVYQEQKGDGDLNNFNLNISYLSSGIYHLLATSGNGESSCRFAVAK